MTAVYLPVRVSWGSPSAERSSHRTGNGRSRPPQWHASCGSCACGRDVVARLLASGGGGRSNRAAATNCADLSPRRTGWPNSLRRGASSRSLWIEQGQGLSDLELYDLEDDGLCKDMHLKTKKCYLKENKSYLFALTTPFDYFLLTESPIWQDLFQPVYSSD